VDKKTPTSHRFYDDRTLMTVVRAVLGNRLVHFRDSDFLLYSQVCEEILGYLFADDNPRRCLRTVLLDGS
jgi:hypothetical protein